ncbi:MAG TPA: hypothetical protein VFM25_07000 [Verrucomicrobiae bacterium]|nr:hypothetical protein [Verrucomicrobiae bacterium]
MNLAQLEQKLFAIARRHSPGAQVPYAFEKRIMALIKNCSVVDKATWWARALWRSAAACVALALLLSAVSFFIPEKNTPAFSNDLSQAFEKTLLVAVDQDTEFSR